MQRYPSDTKLFNIPSMGKRFLLSTVAGLCFLLTPSFGDCKFVPPWSGNFTKFDYKSLSCSNGTIKVEGLICQSEKGNCTAEIYLYQPLENDFELKILKGLKSFNGNYTENVESITIFGKKEEIYFLRMKNFRKKIKNGEIFIPEVLITAFRSSTGMGVNLNGSFYLKDFSETPVPFTLSLSTFSGKKTIKINALFNLFGFLNAELEGTIENAGELLNLLSEKNIDLNDKRWEKRIGEAIVKLVPKKLTLRLEVEDLLYQKVRNSKDYKELIEELKKEKIPKEYQPLKEKLLRLLEGKNNSLKLELENAHNLNVGQLMGFLIMLSAGDKNEVKSIVEKFFLFKLEVK